MTVIAAKRKITGSTWGYFLATLLGVAITIAGGLLLAGWISAPVPGGERVTMYRNNLTKFVPVISFNPGLPRAEVSFQKFEQESAGKEFVVAYPEKWNTGQVVEIDIDSSRWQPAVYMMKKPDIDGYQIAYLRAPDFNADVFGYSRHTEFDPATKEFFSVFDGRHYGWLIGGILFFIFGFLITAASYLSLYDELGWHWFRDVTEKWRNSQLYRDIHYGRDG